MKSTIALVGGSFETETGFLHNFSLLIEDGLKCTVHRNEELLPVPGTKVFDISGYRIIVPEVDFSFLGTEEDFKSNSAAGDNSIFKTDEPASEVENIYGFGTDNQIRGSRQNTMGWSFMRFNLHPADSIIVKDQAGEVLLSLRNGDLTFKTSLG